MPKTNSLQEDYLFCFLVSEVSVQHDGVSVTENGSSYHGGQEAEKGNTNASRPSSLSCPACGMVLPAFRSGLPSLANPFWKHLTDTPRGVLC
jgi:hypothetical protein